MEPAAPGTEDEIQNTIPTFNKKENEQERLLSIKIRFMNGKYRNVFELSYYNGTEHWYCHLCECPVMGRVYHHEIGKRHSSHMEMVKKYAPPIVEPPTIQIAPGEPVPPGFEGEIDKVTQIQERLDSYTVGPLIGLEYLLEVQEYDREREPSYLCTLCDKRGDPRTVIAHLGSYNHISQYLQRHFVQCYRALSPYITKQYKRNWQLIMSRIAEAIEEKFGRLKPKSVEKESFEKNRNVHYQNLIQRGPHFNESGGCTFVELVDKDMLTKPLDGAESAVRVNMTKLSEDVAKRPYRKTGTVPGAAENKKRSPSPPVVAKPKKPKPAVVNSEKRRSLSSVSTISSSDLSEFEAGVEKGKEFGGSKGAKRYRSRSPFKRSRRSRSRSPQGKGFNRGLRDHKSDLPPWQRSDYIRTKSDYAVDGRNNQKTDKMEEFKKLASAIDKDMERILKQHEKNPEKHPQYNEEWKKFWNKRYKELQAEGKDAANYDFKPDWIEYWTRRMTELHNSENKSKKDALRKRLNLPEEPAPICFKITGKKRPGTNEETRNVKPAPAPIISDHDSDVIIIDDRDDDTLSSKRSHSPWESEPLPHSISRSSRDREKSWEDRDKRSRNKDCEAVGRSKSRRSWDKDFESRERERAYSGDPYRRDYPEYFKPPRVMRDVTRQPVHSPPLYAELEDDREEINVVSVLRLLTALEEKLGSLGPKVIDILGQALALEKNEANSSETLLDNEVNCVLFETVKEKLKGLLLAGLVSYVQEKAFKNAIKKIASLVHLSNERKRQKEKKKPKVDPVKVPGVGTVDKAAIAKQIATALIVQGKTDVTQVELEQLIDAVVGMAEASRNSDKPVTTAAFLQKLTEQTKPGKIDPVFSVLQNLQSTSAEMSSSNMEGLSDSDLQTLLQNFKDLSTEEQHGLITYLKKLEAREPERVERLRRYVNLGSNNSAAAEKGGGQKKEERKSSPFSCRVGSVNPMVEENFESDDKEGQHKEKPTKINLDSDEEEYSYEDVFKAATKNVKEKELEKERVLAEETSKRGTKMTDTDLIDTKAIIANIIGQFGAKKSSIGSDQPASNLLGIGGREASVGAPDLLSVRGSGTSASVSVADLLSIASSGKPAASGVSATATSNFVQSLSSLPVSVANLTNIVSNVQQNMARQNLLQENAPRRQNVPVAPRNVANFLENPDFGPNRNVQPQNFGNMVENPNFEPNRNVQPQNFGNMGENPNFEANRNVQPQNFGNMGQNFDGMGQNFDSMGQNIGYPHENPNMPPGPNNYLQNVTYPQHNSYINHNNRNVPYSTNPNNFGNAMQSPQDRFNNYRGNHQGQFNRYGNDYNSYDNHW